MPTLTSLLVPLRTGLPGVRFGVVDIVEADSPADVEKASMIIRCYGHATTETMHATPWKAFLAGL